jgi:hypothetical protein
MVRKKIDAEEDSAAIVVTSGSDILRSTAQANSSAYASSDCACPVLGEMGNHECICQYADGKDSSRYDVDSVGLPPLSGKPRTQKCQHREMHDVEGVRQAGQPARSSRV